MGQASRLWLQNAEKHPRPHNTTDFKVDGLQKWMITLDPIPFSLEQYSEAQVGTRSEKMDKGMFQSSPVKGEAGFCPQNRL